MSGKKKTRIAHSCFHKDCSFLLQVNCIQIFKGRVIYTDLAKIIQVN